MIKIFNKNGHELVSLDANSLCEADLRWVNLRGSDIIIIMFENQTTYIIPGHIRIGCGKQHSLEEWKNFNDQEIEQMHSNTLDFWKENKELIINLCERFEK